MHTLPRRAAALLMAKTPLHSFPPVFYAKVTAASFALGAAMELFMIKTGFYGKVTALEAERRANPSEFGKAAPNPWAGRE